VTALDERVRAWLWPVMRRVLPAVRVQCVDIVNVGFVERPLPLIADHFRAALAYIESAGEDLNRKVCSNVRRIAITRGSGEQIAVAEGKYGTSLLGHEGQNPFYLACRLVWVATYIDLKRKSPSSADSDEAIREQSYDAVLDFVAGFPEGDEWVPYIERERLKSKRR
jgi:hypothetical protein